MRRHGQRLPPTGIGSPYLRKQRSGIERYLVPLPQLVNHGPVHFGIRRLSGYLVEEGTGIIVVRWRGYLQPVANSCRPDPAVRTAGGSGTVVWSLRRDRSQQNCALPANCRTPPSPPGPTG